MMTLAELQNLEVQEGWGADDFMARMPQMHQLVKEILDTYLDMGERELEILALWIEAVNAHAKFGTFPELYINGGKGTGKTRVLNLIKALVPKSVKAVGMSEAAMFRLAGENDALILDEAEDLGAKEKKTVKDLLNAAYKRGANVYRVEGDKNKVVQAYSVYCGIAMANVYGLDSVIEDKCITIVMEKSNGAKTRIPELFEMDKRFSVVNQFYREGYVVYSVYYDGFGGLGMRALVDTSLHIYNIYNYTYYTQLLTEPVVKQFCDYLTTFKQSGRQSELWLPLLIQLYITKNMERASLLLGEAEKDKEQDELAYDNDLNFAIFLFETIDELKRNELSVRELKERYEEQEGKSPWLDSFWIGYFMKRGKFATKQRKNTGSYWKISPAKLKKYLAARHAFSEQGSLQKPEPKPVEIATEPVICPKCAKSVNRVVDTAQGYMCPDCANKAKAEQDEAIGED